MRGPNWIRLLLCGYAAGVVWYLFSALLLVLFAQDFLGFVKEGGSYPKWGEMAFFGIDLVMGVWVIWLYSAISKRYGERPTTAIIAGVVWWALKSLQSAKWVGIGLVPYRLVLIPLVATLVAASSHHWLVPGCTAETPGDPGWFLTKPDTR